MTTSKEQTIKILKAQSLPNIKQLALERQKEFDKLCEQHYKKNQLTAVNKAQTTKIQPQNITIKSNITMHAPYWEFTSTAYLNGKKIIEPQDSTKQSLFGVTHRREVSSYQNPVGIVHQYWGAMQHNEAGADNIALYALVNKSKYSSFANKFFNPGYETALKAFKEDIKKNPKDAWGILSPTRKALIKYIKPNYKELFIAEGKNNPESFLQLQRDAASTVTASYYNLEKVVTELKKVGISPTSINPSVWSVIISAGIARGNTSFTRNGKKYSVTELFKNKSLQQINSPQMIDEIAQAYPTAFRKNAANEQAAIQFAKDHINEKHSITTARELSLMLGDEQVYHNYLANLKLPQQTQNTQMAALKNTQTR